VLLRLLMTPTRPRSPARSSPSSARVSVVSSGFEKNLSTLRSFELIDYPSRGEVVALPVLFFDWKGYQAPHGILTSS
jgi:hypothetical protein